MVVLSVEPANAAARQMAATNWSDSLFKLQMLPVRSGDRIRAFGFSVRNSSFDAKLQRLEIEPAMTFSEGSVTTVFEDWRLEPQADPPPILGGQTVFDQSSTNYACFETTAAFDAGMSGGSVFRDDSLVGIVSTGWMLDDDGSGACSRAALLWPLMFMREIPTVRGGTTFVSLLESGVVTGTDWVDAGMRTYVEEVAGRVRPRFKEDV